ncbi:MaoC/PaaZ C-terminal domain-containing protein [Bacteriovorax sp. Seq25_V]|uniref:MaoC/PaaZ C-terminal domain-containing protein n=1 Tax=Bacteriovorax sp. Seq25_V TaxID=1201288 RepID=UPI00038A3F17|nr:MaoC/PaaZ C-terminal domain-containing protein [Bacteriovorax sp. Seq25_V]EQC43758.1 MaoC-like protein [Bacteriovorax sp. Seq25_V]
MELPNTLKLFVPTLKTITRKPRGREAKSNTMSFTLPSIDKKTLNRYLSTLGLRQDLVPLSFFYLFAQRAHIAQMIAPDFPYPLLGIVHVSNEMEYLSDVDLDKSIEIISSLNQDENLIIFNVVFKQNGKEIIKCVSHYLIAKAKNKKKQSNSTSLVLEKEFDFLSEIEVSGADGRNYAIASGDFNFIHLHPFLAKLFGFRTSIIHGMFMAAKVNGILEESLARRVNYFQINFKKPIFLPSKVTLENNKDSFRVTSKSGERLHLHGSFRAIS